MNYLKQGIAIGLLSLFSLTVHSADIYECLDQQGIKSYQQFPCPEGSTTVSVRKSSGKSSGSSTNPDITAVMYSIPDCNSCVEVREFLALRGIDVIDNDVSQDIELQNELKEITGKLDVPVVVIEDAVIVGYERNKLLSALNSAGYQEPVTEQTEDQ